jgi:hypothetical protein
MSLVDGDLWKMQRVGGMSSGEGLIVKVADRMDENGNVIPAEKRLFVLEEEFCRVLANMSRQGNILSPIIRQAFDNGNLCTLTVNPRYAFGAHVSIVAHITPEELENRFDGIEAANGFGNRFLWFYVASDKVLSPPHPIPAKVFQDFAPRLRSASGLKPQQVSMNGAAQDLCAVHDAPPGPPRNGRRDHRQRSRDCVEPGTDLCNRGQTPRAGHCRGASSGSPGSLAVQLRIGRSVV